MLAVLELPGVVGAVVEARHDGRVRVAQAAVVGGLAEVEVARRRDQALLQDGLGVTLEEADALLAIHLGFSYSRGRKKKAQISPKVGPIFDSESKLGGLLTVGPDEAASDVVVCADTAAARATAEKMMDFIFGKIMREKVMDVQWL